MAKNLYIYLIFILLTGCTVGKGTGVFPPAANLDATPPLSADDDGRDHRILIANGLSETITLVERINGTWTVTPDILPTGQAPGQMVVRDGLAYLVCSLSNSIQIIDTNTLTTVREISTGPGTNPMMLDFIDDETVIVTCYVSNDARILDLNPDTPSNERIKTIIPMPGPADLPHDEGASTLARPGGVVVLENRAYVVCANLLGYHQAGGPGLLVEIDLVSMEITATHALHGRDTLSVIHSPRLPDRLIILSAGTFTYEAGFIGDGTVESFDLNTGEIFQVIDITGAPYAGIIGADDILLMENGMESAILRADLRNGTQLESYSLPTYGLSLSYASSILALPGILAVTNFNADRLYILDPVTGEILVELPTGDGPDVMALI